MGGQGQALLYSYDPASRAGPPDSRSRRRRAPGRTSPAPTIPAASSGAPLLAMGKSLHQGPTGQAQQGQESGCGSLDSLGHLGRRYFPSANATERNRPHRRVHPRDTRSPWPPSLPTSSPHSSTCRSAPRGRRSPPGSPTPWCGRALRSEAGHAKIARCRGLRTPRPAPRSAEGAETAPNHPAPAGRAPCGRPGPLRPCASESSGRAWGRAVFLPQLLSPCPPSPPTPSPPAEQPPASPGRQDLCPIAR